MTRYHISSTLKALAAALLVAGLALLAGCATVPEPLRAGPKQSPTPAQVGAAPEQYAGMTVRWGGIIVSVENGPQTSKLEVVSRPLGSDARPLDTDQTSGRFIAIINGFVDPMSYQSGRELTVVGVLDGVEKSDVGKYHYTYPVVKVTGHYLWPLRPLVVPGPYYYYSPFYDPWYPFWPYYYPYSYSYPYYYPYHTPIRPRPRGEPIPPFRSPGGGTQQQPIAPFIRPGQPQPAAPPQPRPRRERR